MYTAMTKAASAVVLGAAMAEAFAPAAGLSLATPSARLAASSAPPLRGALRRPAATRLLAHVDPASAFHVIDSLQAGLALAQEAAEELEEVYAPSAGGYAQTSYYGTLGLYLVSLPGLYSTITRAVKFKPIQKVYEAPGPAAGREVRQTAGEISAYFRAMNFQPEPTGDKITFRGTMGRSRGQAAFLTFVTFLSMASLAIVLTISNPLVPVNEFSPWYALTLLSPLAGVYYWTNAVKEITVEMKLEESEDGKKVEITTVGQKEELERFVQAMESSIGLGEKGMERVPSLMETFNDIRN